jgi:predicted secreted protein
MATTGTVISGLMAIYTGATPAKITCQVNASLNLKRDTRDITCKDSGDWEDALPARKSWTLSGTGNLALDATNGWKQLYTAWDAGTALACVFQTGVTGDEKYSGSAYVTSLSADSSGSQENVTFSFELKGNGALTKATT